VPYCNEGGINKKNWQGQIDSNYRMTESKSVALPLGYGPINGGGGQIRTVELGESGFTVHRV
jgi:hypothetical protein